MRSFTLLLFLMFAATILGNTYMKVLAKPETVIKVRVDTVRVYDTVTTRARDTVRVFVKNVGRLTQADIVQLICGEAARILESDKYKLHGDKRDSFAFNLYGMVACPSREQEDK